MGAAPRRFQRVTISELSVVLPFAVLPLLLYLVSTAFRAADGNGTLAAVDCFLPDQAADLSLPQEMAAFGMGLGAVLFLFVSPTFLGMLLLRSFPARRATAHAWSIALNSCALVLACLLLRNTSGIGRVPFVVAWSAWTLCLAVAAGATGQARADAASLWKRYRVGLLFATFSVSLFAFVTAREVLLQSFNGDGAEIFAIARSLQDHFLPTWEIETTWTWGAVVVNPTLFNAYWTFALQRLLGENELATRLPYFIYLLGCLLVCFRLQQQSGQRSIAALVCVAISFWIVATWYTFLTGYYSYMADLAQPGVPDILFTLFLLLGFDCLYQKDGAGWFAATLLGSLILYAGPVLFVLTLLAAWIFQPIERSKLLRWGGTGIASLALIAGLYVAWGWQAGLLAGWWSTLTNEYVTEYFHQHYRVHSGLLYFGYFLIGVGGLSAVSLLRAFRRSAWEKTVAAVTLAYLAIILVSAGKSLHYFGPLLPLPALLLGMHSAGNAGRPSQRLLRYSMISLGICLVLCWPRTRPVFTLNRELGSYTTFQTDSYETACRWARMFDRLDYAVLYEIGAVSWTVGPHNWVDYSELAIQPLEPRPLLVTNEDRPPGYAPQPLIVSPEGVKIFVRDPRVLEWAQSRRPLTAPARFPHLFQKIAPLPRPGLLAVPQDALTQPQKSAVPTAP